MEKERIVAVQKNIFGEIINFQTSSGRIISYRKALQEAESGNIAGVEVIEENGVKKLTPDSTETDGGFYDYPLIY
ncbi:MAG: DUF3892 domain-containing protein [Bacillales bacterium]